MIRKGRVRWVAKQDMAAEARFIARLFGLAARFQLNSSPQLARFSYLLNFAMESSIINTDRNPAYAEAIRKLKSSKLLDDSVDHRQVKYLNNQIEADHGAIKRRIRSMLGFKSAKTAYARLKGIEAMRMIRKLRYVLPRPGVSGCSALLQQAVRNLCLSVQYVFATEPF